VKNVQAEQKRVRIAHDDIPGFMQAMTMEFEVKDPAILAGIRSGWAVNFTLEVAEDRAYIVQIESLNGREEPVTPQEEASDAAGGEDDNSSPPGLTGFVPHPAPDFTLTDQDEQSLTLSGLRGKVVVIDFIFTHCPGPCPMLSLKFSQLQQQLSDRLGKEVVLLSVTIDPRRDTPEVLKAYAQRYQANLTGWKFLTGTTRDILMVATAYGADYQASTEGVVDHRLLTCIIDQAGTVVKEFAGANYTTTDLMAEVERALENPTS
jgi:protein SCO1/2